MDSQATRVIQVRHRETPFLVVVVPCRPIESEVQRNYRIYHEKLKVMDEAVRLTKFWTRETAKETMKCAVQTHLASEYVKDAIGNMARSETF